MNKRLADNHKIIPALPLQDYNRVILYHYFTHYFTHLFVLGGTTHHTKLDKS